MSDEPLNSEPVRGAAPLETPVALFVFNRPEQTARVFAEIARARPRTLLLVADGPRPDHPTDEARCAAARAVLDRIDWDCTVHRNYSESNLGCRLRVSSGLDWVFEKCESAIILEDDCLPHPSFFRFCEEVLERYRDDERVMMVSGDCFLPESGGGASSYRFSRYNFVWGWASWRRAWRHYDRGISLWPSLRETGWLWDVTGSRSSAAYWRDIFDRVHRGEIDTWDYQWTFASWVQHGLCIVPGKNLISNIGFGANATHTVGESLLANLPVCDIGFPLQHPAHMIPDRAADARIANDVFGWLSPEAPSLRMRVRRSLGSLLPSRLKRVVKPRAVLPACETAH